MQQEGRRYVGERESQNDGIMPSLLFVYEQ